MNGREGGLEPPSPLRVMRSLRGTVRPSCRDPGGSACCPCRGSRSSRSLRCRLRMRRRDSRARSSDTRRCGRSCYCSNRVGEDPVPHRLLVRAVVRDRRVRVLYRARCRRRCGTPCCGGHRRGRIRRVVKQQDAGPRSAGRYVVLRDDVVADVAAAFRLTWMPFGAIRITSGGPDDFVVVDRGGRRSRCRRRCRPSGTCRSGCGNRRAPGLGPFGIESPDRPGRRFRSGIRAEPGRGPDLGDVVGLERGRRVPVDRTPRSSSGPSRTRVSGSGPVIVKCRIVTSCASVDADDVSRVRHDRRSLDDRLQRLLREHRQAVVAWPMSTCSM